MRCVCAGACAGDSPRPRAYLAGTMNDLKLYPLNAMAHRLRVTTKWLREEAEAGRVPCLRAGDRLLFHPPTVLLVLVARAAEHDAQEVPACS